MKRCAWARTNHQCHSTPRSAPTAKPPPKHKVIPKDRAADDSLVQTEFVNPEPSNAAPVRLAFRVRRTENGAPAITDIQVEGVSFASAQRADFTAYLQQHNGSIPELAKNLNALSEKLARKGETQSAGN